jgi:uncharacterized protein
MGVTRPLRRAALAPILLLLLLGAAHALVPVPELSGRVVDKTGTLSESQVRELDAKLSAFEESKGSQVAVLIVPTTQPEVIEQFSIRVAEQWKIGRKKIDDGAILVVALEDRVMRIEVGYGLEGALPDVICKRIIDDIITPHFKSGDIFGGISDGVDAMMKVIDGEALPKPAPRRGFGGNGRMPAGNSFFFLLIAAFVLGSILRASLGRLGGGLLTGGIMGVLGAVILGSLIFAVLAGIASFIYVLVGNAGGTHRRFGGGGGWGGFGGGLGGGGFGGGGGGFSGGGGSFGGGGASGRW